MDPMKVLAAVRKALGMADDAPVEKIEAKLKALAALIAVDEADANPVPAPAMADGEPPPDEEQAAAARALARILRLADGAPAEDEDTQLADEAPPAEQTAAEAACSALFAKLMEMTGLDEASLLDSMATNLDKIVSLLTGTAETSGAPAETDQAALSAAEAKQAALSARLTTREKELKALAKKVADLEHERCTRKIDDAVAKGSILAQHREVFVALAKSNPQEFDRQLASCEGSPAVPTGTIVKEAAHRGKDEPNLTDEQEAFAKRVLKFAKVDYDAAKKHLAAMQRK